MKTMTTHSTTKTVTLLILISLLACSFCFAGDFFTMSVRLLMHGAV